MARVDIGDPLTEPKLTSGWKVSDDGFGLRTCQATYNVDKDSGFDFVRGESFPINEYAYLKLHKQTSSFNALGFQVQVCEYVGISPDVNEGTRTNANLSNANGLTATNITAHPNFFNNVEPYAIALAGLPPYTQDSPNNLAPNVGGQPAYLGANGACFEKPMGGRFIGFVNPDYKTLYGKTQYLSTTSTYSGTIYYTNVAYVQALYALLGTATSTASWGTEYPLLPPWAPIGTNSPWGHKNLLSQVNVEMYGSLYKVNYEVRYAEQGWDSLTYINIVP